MTRAYSARLGRAAVFAVAACLALALAALAHGALAAQQADPSSDMGVAVSLVQSAAAVPVGGTMGFAAVIRLPAGASSAQVRLQVRSIGGRLIYQRTQYAQTSQEGTHTFAFNRPLEGLSMDPGTYPVTLSLSVDVQGSTVDTEVADAVRVYDPSKPLVPVVLLAKVHSRPLGGPSGNWAVDPASPVATRAREEVDSIAALVSADPLARVSLAVTPVILEEWRQLASSGYTLASGTVVPPTNPVPTAYGSTLTHLQQGLATGRLELATQGYSDPSLADLAVNKLTPDSATQYDAGLSAMFASLETTPSACTAPAGGCAPAGMQAALLARHVGFAFVEAESTRIAKRSGVSTGVYPSATSTLTALVIDARASRGMESGDASATLARTFERANADTTGQPVVLRIDLDDSVPDATATVGFALAALEGTPWTHLELGTQARAPKGTKSVTFVPTATRNAPAGFWTKVRSARAHAAGMMDVLTSSDDQATSAQTNSLLAESAVWSEPSAKWALSSAGLAHADAALKTANSVFDAIKISAPSLRLSGQTGKVPVTIQNNSKKTLNVVVVPITTGGMTISGSRAIPVKLPPSDTLVEIPIDMQSVLFGKLTVQVMAGTVVIAKQTVSVSRSYLDRIATVGGIVVLLGGMLVWIVLRVRRSPDVYDDEDEEYSEGDGDEVTPPDNESAQPGAQDDPGDTAVLPVVAPNDAQSSSRYTDSHSETSNSPDSQ